MEQRSMITASNLKAFNAVLTADNTKTYLANVLRDNAKAFTANITALVSSNTNLQRCEPTSLIYAGIKATALDLPLDQNLGFAYVIPYENRKAGKVEAQFQLGYKGYIQLAIRSGQFRTINVVEIRDGELVGFNLLTGEMMFEAVENREQKQVIGYAAYFKLLNGFEKTLYMTTGEMQAHAKRYSQTFGSNNDYIRNSSKWSTDFDAMAKKTALKLLLSKYAPLSVEMSDAYKADQAVISADDTYRYVDHDGDAYQDVDAEVSENGNKEEVDTSAMMQQAQQSASEAESQQQEEKPKTTRRKATF